ncbi:MAG: FAD-dependent oxidoreductase [Lachnospiraceae bacterium]|nr:FAD-dependent oxidoreductase [Lachnospiraceae bacterium]
MKHLIIGNSAAAIGAVEGIRQMNKSDQITIISDEPYFTYSRPLISYLLSGKLSLEKMNYRSKSFYEDNHVTFKYAHAEKVDHLNKQVFLDDGDQMSYDKLLIATGSKAFIPPFAGLESVENKTTFLSLDDVKKLDAMGLESKRVLIIGAGLIGLKCAEGITKKAQSVTVLDLAPQILSSILDYDSSLIVKQHLEKKGINFILSATAEKFTQNTLTLKDKTQIDFDILVLCVGVRPNASLLSGIAAIEKGVVINERAETSVPDIYAAGDVTNGVAILPNAYVTGECAGINMAGGNKTISKMLPMNAIGFFGLNIITAGNYTGSIFELNKDSEFKRLFYQDGLLNGYIMIGNIAKAGIYTSLIREQTKLDTLDFPLICEKPQLMAFRLEERLEKLGGKVERMKFFQPEI